MKYLKKFNETIDTDFINVNILKKKNGNPKGFKNKLINTGSFDEIINDELIGKDPIYGFIIDYEDDNGSETYLHLYSTPSECWNDYIERFSYDDEPDY